MDNFNDIISELTKERDAYKRMFDESNVRNFKLVKENNELRSSVKQLENEKDGLWDFIKILNDAFRKKTLKTEEHNKDIDDIDLVDLNLSIRSFNCLYLSGYKKLKDLSGITYEKLMRIRNLGKNSINEICEKLLKYGIIVTYQDKPYEGFLKEDKHE